MLGAMVCPFALAAQGAAPLFPVVLAQARLLAVRQLFTVIYRTVPLFILYAAAELSPYMIYTDLR